MESGELGQSSHGRSEVGKGSGAAVQLSSTATDKPPSMLSNLERTSSQAWANEMAASPDLLRGLAAGV